MQQVNTPWGQTQYAEEIAPGIVMHHTARHGGIWISEDRRASMPEPYRSIETFAGGNWYEENCDWAIVALSFPEHFSLPGEQEIAAKTFAHYHAKKVRA